jgi:flagellar FliL protein
MADEKPAAGAEEAPPAEKKKLVDNKALILGGVVILQVVLALALTQFVILPRTTVQPASMADTEAGGEDGDQELGIIVPLEEIIISLQGKTAKGLPHYLRINVNLEVDRQATADLVVARLPELRDVVIVTLSSQNADELGTPEGTQLIRSELFRRLSEKLPPKSLRSIYFSDLVIQ